MEKWTEKMNGAADQFSDGSSVYDRSGSSWLQFMINLAFVSGQNFAANSFPCFISTSFQLKEKYLSFEALSVRQ